MPTPQALCKGSGVNVHSSLEGADGHSQEPSLPGKALRTGRSWGQAAGTGSQRITEANAQILGQLQAYFLH